MITRLMLNLRDPALTTVTGNSIRPGITFHNSQHLSTLVDPDNDVTFTQGRGCSGRNAPEGDIELTAITSSY